MGLNERQDGDAGLGSHDDVIAEELNRGREGRRLNSNSRTNEHYCCCNLAPDFRVIELRRYHFQNACSRYLR